MVKKAWRMTVCVCVCVYTYIKTHKHSVSVRFITVMIFWATTETNCRSYFTTRGLPTISSSWRQAPWDSWLEFFGGWATKLFCSHRPYVTSSLMSGEVCLLWMGFTFVEWTCSTYTMLLKILPCALYASALLVQALQSWSCLSYSSYTITGA
jgi:hypothetical protein